MTSCNDRVLYYFTAGLAGIVYSDPPGGKATPYQAVATGAVETALDDNIEGDVSAWSVVNDPSLAGGAWEQADPNGTISGGFLAAPEDDATPGAGNVMAFVTENGPVGGSSGANEDAEKECGGALEAGLALPAYDQCLKASHLFNLLDARGAVSVTERQSYIGRVRALAKGSAEAWVASPDGKD